jgi:hypothetical protein
LGTEELDGKAAAGPSKAGLFSNQLLQFAKRHLAVAGVTARQHPELAAVIGKAQGELDNEIRTAMDQTIEDVKILGYPGLNDPQSIHFRTRIETGSLLDHSTAVQYGLDGEGSEELLPEHAIGLGYQNLQSLSYQLVSFREERLRTEEASPAAVHLVLVEEPEAHLHVQVQRLFPAKALDLISLKGSTYSHLASQLILSTHASHLAHAESLTRLRYVRRKPAKAGAMPASEVVDLADAFGQDEATRIFAERYFQIQHTDLLFADAAIFVEGTAERMLVPLFINRDFKKLRNRYLSFLEIGGSHAQRLRPLVERLGIPTVVITDVDPVSVKQGANGKTTREAEAIINPVGMECGNAALRKWHPCGTALEEFADAANVWREQVWFGWQKPLQPGGSWPSSFEDAFILTNLSWFQERGDETGALGSAIRTAKQNLAATPGELTKAFHELLRGPLSKKKGDFASTLFELLCANEPLQCPTYIAEALTWLEAKLEPSAGSTGGPA